MDKDEKDQESKREIAEEDLGKIAGGADDASDDNLLRLPQSNDGTGIVISPKDNDSSELFLKGDDLS